MTNVESAYEFFVNKGFTPAQSAGIVGNLVQESGVNPESSQAGGPGRGIAQWSQGGRWNPGLMTGNPALDLQAQENYIMQELQQNPTFGLAALQQASTPTDAAKVFGTDFERYGIAGNRVQDAQQVYDQAQTNDWPTAGGNTATASATLAGYNGSGGTDPFSVVLGVLGLGGIGGAVSDVSKIADELATILGFAGQKQPQTLQGNGFLNSFDELLNPSITLFAPWNAITMFTARGALVLLGFALIAGGIATFILATKSGREAVGAAVKGAAMA